jgi:hypothetical protein
MYIAHVILYSIVSLLYPVAVMLSVYSDVVGCGCQISSNVVHIFFASFAFRKAYPFSSSAADDITCLKSVMMIKMAPLANLFWL